jgi:hypothetical protein
VPASEELRSLGTRSHPPDGDAELRPSSRPTLSFELGTNAELPSVDVEPASADALLAPRSQPAPTIVVHEALDSFSPGWEALGSVAPSSLPPARPRRRSRARTVLSRLLFATLLAGVAALCGLAAKKKFDAASQAPDSAGPFAGAR